MAQPSTLAPIQYVIEQRINGYIYTVELMTCYRSDHEKWFIKQNGRLMVFSYFDSNVYLGKDPYADLGFDTAELALAAFDEKITALYADKHRL